VSGKFEENCRCLVNR